MTPDTDLSPGFLAEDCESDSPDMLLVIEISDAPCDDPEEAFVEYDWKQNALTVADKNEEFGYDPNQPFAVATFISSLNDRCPDWAAEDLDHARKRIEEEHIRTYKYPVNRLNPMGKQFVD